MDRSHEQRAAAELLQGDWVLRLSCMPSFKDWLVLGILHNPDNRIPENNEAYSSPQSELLRIECRRWRRQEDLLRFSSPLDNWRHGASSASPLIDRFPYSVGRADSSGPSSHPTIEGQVASAYIARLALSAHTDLDSRREVGHAGTVDRQAAIVLDGCVYSLLVLAGDSAFESIHATDATGNVIEIEWWEDGRDQAIGTPLLHAFAATWHALVRCLSVPLPIPFATDVAFPWERAP